MDDQCAHEASAPGHPRGFLARIGDNAVAMTASAETEQFMLAAWDDAVQSSGLNASAVHLLPVPGAAVSESNKAACYPPHVELVEEPHDLLRGAMLTESNLPEHQGKHRIAIYEDVDQDDPVAVATMAATLRHELRHAEQREVCGGDLFPLDELADQLVSWKIGGLPKAAALYHLKPIELDADAASAVFLRQQYPAQVDAILAGEDAVLARSNTPPGRLDDLPTKTVCFLFCLREVAEDPTRSPSGLSFRNRLRLINRHWAKLWDDLEAATHS